MLALFTLFPINCISSPHPASLLAYTMDVTCRRRAELRDRNTSPERTKVWTEPKPKPRATERKVPVVYYLSRNGGHLEHPHLMEVSVPPGQGGLYLRDVIKRLNSLRGKGMGGAYAWSSKRSYKNGFVWHDLCEDDFIYPSHDNEYILKGSELLHLDSSLDNELEEVPKSVKDDSGILFQRKSRPAWGLFDLGEYKVYVNKMMADASVKNVDAWTQTEDRRPKNKQSHAIEEIDENKDENTVTELGRDEISPPLSSSSSETMDELIKIDCRIVPIAKDGDAGSCSRRKMRTPAALMQLISCSSISVKERGFSLVSHLKGRLPRAISGAEEGLKERGGVKGSASSPLEDKEYFSGSLVEIKKKASDRSGEVSGLQRSSSCNAQGGLKMELLEKEIEGVGECILLTS